MKRPRIVALGGGHGLSASLQALRHSSDDITAVVTVADDGGSSGRLREQFDILPPGDLRMALAALCEDTAWGNQWSAVLQHRFGGTGELAGHALGNLLISALWDLLPQQEVRGLDLVGRLLNTRGRVLPMSLVPLSIEAIMQTQDLDGTVREETIRGQSQVAGHPGKVVSIRLLPDAPPACPEALESIKLADMVVLGPGSWFTSVMPHLLVPDLREALTNTPALRVLTLNVSLTDDEATGYTVAEHVEAITAHAPGLAFDYVIADPDVLRSDEERAALDAAVDGVGATLVLSGVRKMATPGAHDTLRLAAAYRDVLTVGL
ncbi:MAG: uridine diphosphate-N-acetylglucosamine-binding protein YvcK [Ornithinimicrobium sp.]|uniref:gluconeogenesis factor YvcK family protein n=1 Tax=Ornithinimicrobium sp. TaxID=1977084 RepID=UPI0026DF0483|nr:uridine diphosphate-N-acetylglucosamine-binding protein YvcK [Ornithinimicrobium sp.]MDO5738679.1 uridine diphosphate-N-acetylglucosamine-binding protein YvcK [Ornithinimicrobium sp.]